MERQGESKCNHTKIVNPIKGQKGAKEQIMFQSPHQL